MNRITFDNFGGLIKWPQCVITGKQITIEQAKEVLARTDMFFHSCGSNQHGFDRKIWNEIGCQFFNWNDSNHKYNDEKQNEFNKKRKAVELNFLDNSYISTSFIGGVYGWCHPDGVIHFWDNIGKWPTWEEVYDDCVALAEAFPFLDMKVYLFNQEGNCEEYYDYKKECVGGFSVKDGTIELLNKSEWLDPHDELCYAPYKDNWKEYMYNAKKNIFGENADNSILEKSWGELFFTEKEFKEYFKEYFYN